MKKHKPESFNNNLIPECSPNEVFTMFNASCQPKCGASFNNLSSLNCGNMHGCVCKSGMIRSSKTQKCVSEEKCRRIISESTVANLCGENEHFSDINGGCQPSCFTLEDFKTCQPASGCVCDDGFVRDISYGECIQLTKCPSNMKFIKLAVG